MLPFHSGRGRVHDHEKKCLVLDVHNFDIDYFDQLIGLSPRLGSPIGVGVVVVGKTWKLALKRAERRV